MITLQPSEKPNKAQQNLIDRKYGMFIHFGINTFNDTEWSDGKLPVTSYNPTFIDAEGWVKNAKDAGMKYVIIITKHHDGFCLYNTKYTDYSVNFAPNKTDVVAEVAKACKKYGIKLGLYYSLWDRHEKCYKKDEQYVDYMCNQLAELLDGRYGEICEIWFDGGWDKRPAKWNLPRIYDVIKSYQPDCAVGINLTIGHSWEKGWNKRFEPHKYKENMPIRFFPCDFRLWDPHFPRKDDPKIYLYKKQRYYLPFESTICIRNMNNWFWDPKYNDDKLVDTDFIVEKYRLLTESQNALVVNVAPNTNGVQVKGDIDRLLEVAKALRIGIYEG